MLTKLEIAYLDGQLKEREAELRQTLHSELTPNESSTAGLVNYSETTDDQAVSTVLSDLDADKTSRHWAELSTIKTARQRIEQNTYGLCLACALPIKLERLLANPSAERCLQCQEKLEYQKGFTSPRL